MKLTKKITIFFLSLIFVCGIIMNLVEKKDVSAAETARISVSSGNCEVGDTVDITISVSGSNIMLCDFIVNYDASMITPVSGSYDAGGNGVLRFISTDATSFKVTFKAIKPGTASISVAKTTAQIGSMTEDYMNVVTSSGSITITAPQSYSTDNTLSSLEISPGVLSPAFSPNVTTYTTSVGSDCQKLTVSAVANDSKATVSVTGTRMDIGLNTTTITVTAENGSKKVYTIKTTKADDIKTSDNDNKNDDNSQIDNTVDNKDNGANAVQQPTVSVNGYEYSIISSFDEHPLPDGYVQSETDYNGIKIAVGMGIDTNITLVYLESDNGQGESGFYVYDTVNRTFSKYIQIYQPDLSYCILPIDVSSMELPDGYDMVKLTISGEEVDALLDRTGNYALFYGVSSTGETGWFRYNVNDGTIQGYAGYNMADEQVINTNTKTADSDKAFNTVSSYIFVILAVLAVVIIALIVVVIALSIKLSKSKKAFVGAMDGYEDEDIDEEDLDDMELEDDEEDILYDDLEEDIDEEVSDDAVPYQSSTTKDLPEEYNESEELELEEIDDK